MREGGFRRDFFKGDLSKRGDFFWRAFSQRDWGERYFFREEILGAGEVDYGPLEEGDYSQQRKKKRVFTEFLFIWLERTTLRYAFLLFFLLILGRFLGIASKHAHIYVFYFLWFLLKISLVPVSFSSLIYLYSCFDSC